MADFTEIPRPFYPSLSPQNREIRLLHLKPGNHHSGRLQCRLSVVALDSNLSYEALSHRWGRGESTVLVDEKLVFVPRIS
jgi:hypothetical protein